MTVSARCIQRSSKAKYAQALLFVEQAFDAGLPDRTLGGRLSVLADRIREYEARNYPWPDTATAADVLTAPMHEYGLRQGDLPEVGSQGVVSEVLAGKRAPKLRQVQALAHRSACRWRCPPTDEEERIDRVPTFARMTRIRRSLQTEGCRWSVLTPCQLFARPDTQRKSIGAPTPREAKPCLRATANRVVAARLHNVV
jgi:HTH-type transcriptional regulator / antitoxin HigA